MEEINLVVMIEVSLASDAINLRPMKNSSRLFSLSLVACNTSYFPIRQMKINLYSSKSGHLSTN